MAVSELGCSQLGATFEQRDGQQKTDGVAGRIKEFLFIFSCTET